MSYGQIAVELSPVYKIQVYNTPEINDCKYYVCKYYAHTKSYTAIACVHSNASKYLCLKIVIVISLRFDVVAALDST